MPKSNLNVPIFWILTIILTSLVKHPDTNIRTPSIRYYFSSLFFVLMIFLLTFQNPGARREGENTLTRQALLPNFPTRSGEGGTGLVPRRLRSSVWC